MPAGTTQYSVHAGAKIILSVKCDTLTSLYIPEGVTSISHYAFDDCTALKTISFPNSLTDFPQRLSEEDGASFNYYMDGEVKYLGNESNPYLILCHVPETVTAFPIRSTTKIIYEYAFYNCANLTSISIPNTVTYIGDFAFAQCSGLESIVIPKSVKHIGQWAFGECTSLRSVVFPENLAEIPSHIFYECYSLQSISIPETVTRIGNGAFAGCSA